MTHRERQVRYRTEQAGRASRYVTANPQIVTAGFRDRATSLPSCGNVSALIRSGSAPCRETSRWALVAHRAAGVGRLTTSTYFACRSQWPPTGDDHSLYKTRPPCSRGRVGSILTPSPRVDLARTAREVRRSGGYQTSRRCQIRILRAVAALPCCFVGHVIACLGRRGCLLIVTRDVTG